MDIHTCRSVVPALHVLFKIVNLLFGGGDGKVLGSVFYERKDISLIKIIEQIFVNILLSSAVIDSGNQKFVTGFVFHEYIFGRGSGAVFFIRSEERRVG